MFVFGRVTPYCIGGSGISFGLTHPILERKVKEAADEAMAWIVSEERCQATYKKSLSSDIFDLLGNLEEVRLVLFLGGRVAILGFEIEIGLM